MYQFIKFCFTGLLSLLLDMLTTLTLKKYTDLDLRICAIAGFTLAGFINFYINRIWVFESHSLNYVRDYAYFLIIAILGLLLRVLLMTLLLNSNLNLNDATINLVGIITPALFSYFSLKYFVFTH